MLLTKKIRLKPTPEQEILFWKSAGVARWAYNFRKTNVPGKNILQTAKQAKNQ